MSPAADVRLSDDLHCPPTRDSGYKPCLVSVKGTGFGISKSQDAKTMKGGEDEPFHAGDE
ncbi:hypothetical protein AKJ16_DCAP09974 [Drosera capensis]